MAKQLRLREWWRSLNFFRETLCDSKQLLAAGDLE